MKDLSKNSDTPITKESGIFDLDNFSIKHMTWKPGQPVRLKS